MLPEAGPAVVGATVEPRNMTCAAAAAVAVVVRVKGALGFVEGKRMAQSVEVEHRDTVGAC